MEVGEEEEAVDMIAHRHQLYLLDTMEEMVEMVWSCYILHKAKGKIKIEIKIEINESHIKHNNVSLNN
jgi:hypothetical protein